MYTIENISLFKIDFLIIIQKYFSFSERHESPVNIYWLS